jgi:hypothetical protein
MHLWQTAFHADEVACYLDCPLDLNPAHSTPGMQLKGPNDGACRRFWYSEPYLTFGEVRLRCVEHREIYESPVIIVV